MEEVQNAEMLREIEISEKIKNKYECKIIINKTKPYSLYFCRDIAKITGIINIYEKMRKFGINDKYKIKHKTNGGIQESVFITLNAVELILLKSRKPNCIELSSIIGLNVKTTYYTAIETDTLNCILKTFHGKNMVLQYFVDKYHIDLYFPDQKLAIECDELQHDSKNNITNDKIRELYITEKLQCKFIRFSPYKNNFNLFKLLNQIFTEISK
jgi:very-short-patch-repair endonuclease